MIKWVLYVMNGRCAHRGADVILGKSQQLQHFHYSHCCCGFGSVIMSQEKTFKFQQVLTETSTVGPHTCICRWVLKKEDVREPTSETGQRL